MYLGLLHAESGVGLCSCTASASNERNVHQRVCARTCGGGSLVGRDASSVKRLIAVGLQGRGSSRRLQHLTKKEERQK